MKESYREGVANHPGPEPCECSLTAALEALDRGICRLGIELRNHVVQGADGVRQQGRPQRGARQRECGAALRSRRPQACRETSCARTGRPVVRGYFQYHAIPGNWARLKAFRNGVLRIWFQTLRRRSQCSRLSWQRFRESLGSLLPPIQILQPYPSVRFDAKHPNIRGRNRVR
jgi:hypothetical protein